MDTAADTALPDDVEQLKAALLAERAARREVEARVADAQAMIEHLKLRIAMFEQHRFGASSERGRKILDQLQLQLEELETEIAETRARAATGEDGTTIVRAFTRAKPVRKPFPDHLPRERVVLPSPTACPCCGGKLVKLGETSTETLESIPRTYKVIQTVREKFACRSCESITEPPAPFHPIPRGRAGAHLLADILHGKFCEHQPLNRQSESFARDGLDLSVSTLADWVGACTTALTPLILLIEAHVLAAERIHGDDTTVPVLAKGKTITGRLWTYVRDDEPFGGQQPPAAFFRYSRDRTAEHPARHLVRYAGILQADAYAGYNDLYHPARKPAPITEAGCWAHGRRKLFKLAELARAPLAIEAVRRIDEIFDIERELNGLAPELRRAGRQARVLPLVTELDQWMRGVRNQLSRHSDVAKAMDYMLKRWTAFTRFLDDGRICLTTDGVEKPQTSSCSTFSRLLCHASTIRS